VVRRGLIRFLVVVLDCSESMNQRDMRPSRMEVVAQVVKTFIDNFFDQNPISQLALIELRDSAANRITELSGNARNHKGIAHGRIERCPALVHRPSLNVSLDVLECFEI
jgi:transcription initiation factor TFIIH subunit 2